MESMRDIDRAMEREIARGSCPLRFVKIDFSNSPYQEKSCQRYCPICCGQAIMAGLPGKGQGIMFIWI